MDAELLPIFKNKLPNQDKLVQEGFKEERGTYVKTYILSPESFELHISIDLQGVITYQVMDLILGEEYVMVHIAGAAGNFVGQIRSQCEEILKRLAATCFDRQALSAPQTLALISFIKREFGADPEFLWEAHPDYAAFRRSDNRKWFATLMNIGKDKVQLPGTDNIDVINLKAKPEQVCILLKEEGFHPAYHMNKKHWFTLRLDGTVDEERIYELIRDSFALNGRKSPVFG